MTMLCRKCRREKPLSEFGKKKTGAGGLTARCKACLAVANKEYRANNGDKIAAKISDWHRRNPGKKFEYHKKKYERPTGRAMHLYNSAKKRMPYGFALTIEHITAELSRGRCAVTGILFEFRVNSDGKRSRSFSPFAPSLDKIDARKPYTDENTRAVIWQYNIMKGELSDAQLLELCRSIVAMAS